MIQALEKPLQGDSVYTYKSLGLLPGNYSCEIRVTGNGGQMLISDSFTIE